MQVKESNNMEVNYHGGHIVIFLFIISIICGNFITFRKELELSSSTHISTVQKLKNYGSIELWQYKMMMNKHPGYFLLMPSTVMWIRSLKIQRKIRKNHCGGVRRFKLLSSGVNINNLIPVVTAGIQTSRENGCKYHFGLVNVKSIKLKEMSLVNYITEQDFDKVSMTETWLKPDKDDAWRSGSCLNRNGYTLECCDRFINKGGGIGLIKVELLA